MLGWLSGRVGMLAVIAGSIAACSSSADDGGTKPKRTVREDAWQPDEPSPKAEPTPDLLPRQVSGALIYLVSEDHRLYSFDPRIPGREAYALIGKLDCKSWSIPQSMAVDRHGIAWVFYSSGELFRVSVADASCTPTPYKHPPGTTQLGMGFTSAANGSSDDVLFIMSPGFGLATVGFPSLAVDQTGRARMSAELTGGGDGRLFAFSAENGAIAEIDRRSYDASVIYNVKIGGRAHAWAFSRYAGKFYVFTSIWGEHSKNTEVDVDRKTERVRDADVGFMVVGAGQSTLVPPRDGGSLVPNEGIREDFKPE